MFFQEFRKIVQDYCREWNLCFLSKEEYKDLHKQYNSWVLQDNDIAVGQFLDAVDFDWEEKVNKLMDCPPSMSGTVYPDGSVLIFSCEGNTKTFLNVNEANNFLKEYMVKSDLEQYIRPKAVRLAPLPKAVPQGITFSDPFCVSKQEGTTPMRYNDNYASATASVATQPTDTSVTRDYLLKRLASADYPKDCELRKTFNLYVDNTPKTYLEMIAIIKAGTYTIDPKIEKRVAVEMADPDENNCGDFFGPLCGIIWPGPVADPKGFSAAQEAKGKQYTAAKDTIMVGSAADGLAALKAFEAWVPTPATPAS